MKFLLLPFRKNISSVFLLILTTLIYGCGNGKKLLQEQTDIQAKRQIEAENHNTLSWAAGLESDLKKKRAFINAIEGEYQGQFLAKQTTYMIRLVIVATIPDYKVSRNRTLAELEYELQNLNLNIQIIQGSPSSDRSVGCVLENIKPDYKKGILNLISENCQNTYKLFLSQDELNKKFAIQSQNIASLIENGKINFVRSFQGKLRSNSNSQTFNFSLERM